MADVALPAAADTLSRAADLIETRVADALAVQVEPDEDNGDGWWVDIDPGCLDPVDDPAPEPLVRGGDNEIVASCPDRAYADLIALAYPHALAALVSALRAAQEIAHHSKTVPCADCTDQPDSDCRHGDLCTTVGPLLEFARRLLRKEET